MRSLIFKIAKTPFFGRFMVRWENPLPETERREWRSFNVKSKSGALLKGLWMDTKGAALGTIVLGHPMGKDAKGYFLKNGYGKFYQGCGLNVVVFDFNGFGESTHGSFSFFDDISAIGQFAAEKFPSLPLFYHGISMGGQWSTVTFAGQHAFDFAVLESIPTTLEEFWTRYPAAYRFLKLLYIVMPRFAKKARMIDRISELKRIQALLLIYSKTDDYTPISMGERFKKNSNVPTELWLAESAEHAKMMRSEYKHQYEQKIRAFIHDCLSAYKHTPSHL